MRKVEVKITITLKVRQDYDITIIVKSDGDMKFQNF
jgi:hypothetical protein